VYDNVAGPERAEAHRRAADVLAATRAEPEQIAVHLEQVEPAGDPSSSRRCGGRPIAHSSGARAMSPSASCGERSTSRRSRHSSARFCARSAWPSG
jgi:hypothetical protein